MEIKLIADAITYVENTGHRVETAEMRSNTERAETKITPRLREAKTEEMKKQKTLNVRVRHFESCLRR